MNGLYGFESEKAMSLFSYRSQAARQSENSQLDSRNWVVGEFCAWLTPKLPEGNRGVGEVTTEASML